MASEGGGGEGTQRPFAYLCCFARQLLSQPFLLLLLCLPWLPLRCGCCFASKVGTPGVELHVWLPSPFPLRALLLLPRRALHVAPQHAASSLVEHTRSIIASLPAAAPSCISGGLGVQVFKTKRRVWGGGWGVASEGRDKQANFHSSSPCSCKGEEKRGYEGEGEQITQRPGGRGHKAKQAPSPFRRPTHQLTALATATQSATTLNRSASETGLS